MKKLSIPERITLVREFLPGFGWRECRQWLAAAAPCLAVTVAVCALPGASPGRALGAVLVFLALLAVFYSLFARIDGYQSVYTFLQRRVRFGRKQQKFYDRRGKEALYLAEEQTR